MPSIECRIVPERDPVRVFGGEVSCEYTVSLQDFGQTGCVPES